MACADDRLEQNCDVTEIKGPQRVPRVQGSSPLPQGHSCSPRTTHRLLIPQSLAPGSQGGKHTANAPKSSKSGGGGGRCGVLGTPSA